MDVQFVGIGLYTPSEAARLTGVRAGRIARWLRGHRVHGRQYERLWRPQIELDDSDLHLGFRDLMEVRMVDAFVRAGLSPQRVRRAIELARKMVGHSHPLSTARFRADGRTVFLSMADEDGGDRLIDLLRGQYEFRSFVEPSFKDIDFDQDGMPSRWWPLGRHGRILVDPERAFGQPVESTSSVPVASLVAAVAAEGSVPAAARAWDVPASAIRSALDFDAGQHLRKAA